MGAVGGPQWAGQPYATRPEAGLLGAARGHERVRQPAPGADLRRAGRRLDAEARSRRGSRHPVRPRADRRRLFRRAARRHRQRRHPPRGQHPRLYRGRNPPRRPRRVRSGEGPVGPRVQRRQGQCDGGRADVARGGAGAARRRIPAHRPDPHARRQHRDAAGQEPAPVRHHPDRQSVRRHTVRRGGDADRIARHAAVGGARPAGDARPVRADPRLRPRHRRTRHRQPVRGDPQPRDGAALSASVAPDLASRVEAAVSAALDGGARTADLGGTLGTAAMGDAVLAGL